jgi:hypothetical protein
MESNNFTGAWEKVDNYASVVVSVSSAVNATVNIDWGINFNTSVFYTDSYSYTGNSLSSTYQSRVKAQFCRIRYIGIDTGLFSISTSYKDFMSNFNLSDISGNIITAGNGSLAVALADACGSAFTTRTGGPGKSLYTHLTDVNGNSLTTVGPSEGAYVGASSNTSFLNIDASISPQTDEWVMSNGAPHGLVTGDVLDTTGIFGWPTGVGYGIYYTSTYPNMALNGTFETPAIAQNNFSTTVDFWKVYNAGIQYPDTTFVTGTYSKQIAYINAEGYIEQGIEARFEADNYHVLSLNSLQNLDRNGPYFKFEILTINDAVVATKTVDNFVGYNSVGYYAPPNSPYLNMFIKIKISYTTRQALLDNVQFFKVPRQSYSVTKVNDLKFKLTDPRTKNFFNSGALNWTTSNGTFESLETTSRVYRKERYYITGLTIENEGLNYNIGDIVTWTSGTSKFYVEIMDISDKGEVNSINPLRPEGNIQLLGINLAGTYNNQLTNVLSGLGTSLRINFTLSNQSDSSSLISVGLADSAGRLLTTTAGNQNSNYLNVTPFDLNGLYQASILTPSGAVMYGTLLDTQGNNLSTTNSLNTTALYTQLTDICGKLITSANPLPVIQSKSNTVTTFDLSVNLTSNFIQLPAINIATNKTATINNINLFNGHTDTVWVKLYDVLYADLPLALQVDLTQPANQAAAATPLNSLTSQKYNIAIPPGRSRDLSMLDGLRFTKAVCARATITNNSGTPSLSGYDKNAVLGPLSTAGVQISGSFSIL